MASTATPSSTPRRPARRRDPAAFGAAIYGAILVTAIVAALDYEDASGGFVFFSVTISMLVFWIAHVWAAIEAEWFDAGRDFRWRRVLVVAAVHWPLLQAAALPLVMIALGWAGLWSVDAGVALAAWAGVAELFAFGWIVGRRSYGPGAAALACSAVNGTLGLVIVLLKLGAGH